MSLTAHSWHMAVPWTDVGGGLLAGPLSRVSLTDFSSLRQAIVQKYHNDGVGQGDVPTGDSSPNPGLTLSVLLVQCSLGHFTAQMAPTNALN